ncbi:fatty acid desaturase [Roseovarius aestuariivivens]|uniref:fatty acid desaturase n=1 Tax=Roseovarius aestuariivivens TaxID=1888910 RepID=UPI00108131CA|nr:fatty acid desaturase [Roseovarius aestuariivivens]
MARAARLGTVEWPTLTLLAGCYGLWALGVSVAATVWLPLGIMLTALAITLQSSLCHEALHGHPTRHAGLNEALVFPAMIVFIPYRRFRDLHLAHHRDEALTDPYDDPESNYLDPAVWADLPRWAQALFRANNTLAGRIVLGPLLGLALFLRNEIRLLWRGARGVRVAWALHVPAAALVLVFVSASPMPLWAYLLAVYGAMSLLKIRTFLEHRAHARARGRTVVIEDRGPLALLFLNNNLHVVHHMHPGVAWYRLPALYASRRAHYLRRNDGYLYRSYAEIFRRHFWRAKDPVAHPLRPGGEAHFREDGPHVAPPVGLPGH